MPGKVTGNGSRFTFDYTGARHRHCDQPAAEGRGAASPSTRPSPTSTVPAPRAGRRSAAPAARRRALVARARPAEAAGTDRRRTGVPPTDRASRRRGSAMYAPWTGGNIDEGWTRWVLEQYEFDLHDDSQRRHPRRQAAAAVRRDHPGRPDPARNRRRLRRARDPAGVPRRHRRDRRRQPGAVRRRRRHARSRLAPRPIWRSISCRFRSAT